MKMKPVFWILIGFVIASVIDVSGITSTDTLEKQVLDLQSRVATLESALSVSGTGVTLRSGGTLQLQSAGPMSIKGAIVSLNGGTQVARVGDPVQVTVPTSFGVFQGTGMIIKGSSTVMAGQ